MKDLNHVGLDLQAPLELEFLDQALADEDLLVFVELLDDKLCHLLLLLSFIVVASSAYPTSSSSCIF